MIISFRPINSEPRYLTAYIAGDTIRLFIEPHLLAASYRYFVVGLALPGCTGQLNKHSNRLNKHVPALFVFNCEGGFRLAKYIRHTTIRPLSINNTKAAFVVIVTRLKDVCMITVSVDACVCRSKHMKDVSSFF